MADSRSSSTPPPGEQDVAQLMVRVSDGDVGAFEKVVDLMWKGTFLYAYHLLGDGDQATDVAQEAFVRLWERRAGWDPTRSVGAWLSRTTRNMVISDRRRWKVRMHWMLGKGREDERRPRTPLQDTEASEVRRALQEAIQDLAPRRREVFILFHQQHLSYREIGEIMGIRPQSVANHLQLALGDLRKMMERFLPGHESAERRAPELPDSN
jgi:RNA polymerase sigma-70 factor, ECF subfamily